MRISKKKHGFTLLEMSIVLAIIGTIIGGTMTVIAASLLKSQYDETQVKMDAIQQALFTFRMGHNRIPCPADPTAATTTASFGSEGTSGWCLDALTTTPKSVSITGTTTSSSATITGIASTANLTVGMAVKSGSVFPSVTYIISIDSSTQITVSQLATGSGSSTIICYEFAEGAVPTKALRLPDDYAFDGWGRRFMYVVDIGLTSGNAFKAISLPDTVTTRLTVNDPASSVTPRTQQAIYVLISFGPNGHGAYPRVGGTTRVSSGSLNTDEQKNCDCNSDGTTNGNPPVGTFVQKQITIATDTPNHTKDFDDMVVFGTRSSLRSPTE